jgi:hypothetical protein
LRREPKRRIHYVDFLLLGIDLGGVAAKCLARKT